MTEIEKPCNSYQGTDPFLFISYSHNDNETIYPIINRLDDIGIRIWYDEGIPISSEWNKEIATHLKLCHTFVCFLTQNSIKSESVKDELAKIKKRWNESKNPTILVFLDDCNLEDDLDLSFGRIQQIGFKNRKIDEIITDLIQSLDKSLFRSLEEEIEYDKRVVKVFENLFQSIEPDLNSALSSLVKYIDDFDKYSLEDRIKCIKIEILSILYECDNFRTLDYKRILPEIPDILRLKFPKADPELFTQSLNEMEEIFKNPELFTQTMIQMKDENCDSFYYHITYRHSFLNYFYEKFGTFLIDMAISRFELIKDWKKQKIMQIFISQRKERAKEDYPYYPSILHINLGLIMGERISHKSTIFKFNIADQFQKETQMCITDKEIIDVLIESNILIPTWRNSTRYINIVYQTPRYFRVLDRFEKNILDLEFQKKENQA